MGSEMGDRMAAGGRALLAVANVRDHDLRRALDAEFHSRPSLAVAAPARVEHLAFWLPRHDAAAAQAWERLAAALSARAGRSGSPLPSPGQRHGVIELAQGNLKWERHTEFVSLTLIGPADASRADALAQAGLDALAGEMPGQVIVALEIEIETGSASPPSAEEMTARFGTRNVAAALVLEQAFAATDFRIGSDGVTRMLVRDAGLPAAQLGRIVQRLIELETYRMMAMLGLPLAQGATPVLDELEQSLRAIAADLKADAAKGGDEALLERLMKVTTESEELSNRTAFRLSATQAYAAIVAARLVELHQTAVPGLPRLTTFLERRFSPAMATCRSVETRQARLAERIARTGSLIRTRVDIALELQNQAILSSLDVNARTQLHLQETVEWLSLVAITYYGVGLVGYGLKGLEGLGLAIPHEIAIGIVTPAVFLLALGTLRRLRGRPFLPRPWRKSAGTQVLPR